MNNQQKLLIVSNDAGAANIICAWLASGRLRSFNVDYYLSGPAASIFSKTVSSDDLLEVISEYDVVLTGTGWSSDLEYNAIKICSNKSIRCIAVLDHWVNYKQRFVRNGQEYLPTEIWVVDPQAKKIAEEQFDNITVVEKNNDYVNKIIHEITYLESSVEKEKCHILFLMEPIREKWKGNDIGEFQSFSYFIKHLTALGLSHNDSIKIRPHPSDAAGKYDDLLKRYSTLNLSIDDTSSLSENLAWSKVVVGCQSFAMTIALQAKRKVISAIPHHATRCVLPHEGIVHLSDLEMNNDLL